MAPADPNPTSWPFPKKLLLCFSFIFFTLYIVLNPNEVVPYSYYLHKLYIQPCNHLIEWLAKDVLHLVSPAISFYNGTIDTVFGYVTVLFIIAAAFIAAVIWVIAGRNRNNYDRIYEILIIILRYFLAITWVAYGALKIIKLQFPSFSPVTLLQTYGNSTPKELAWAFMGYSTGYNYFIGICECAIGLLLFFRRTSALGGIFALGVLANVVAFNYSFDVNVKLLTTVLMLMSLFLLTKDFTRLANFFFFNKPVQPAAPQPFRFKKKWENNAFIILKCSFIACILFFDLHGDFERAKQQGAGAIKPPLYGIYDVTVFIRNRDTLKPLNTDTTRWNKLIVSTPAGNASIMLMNGRVANYSFAADTLKKQIEMDAKANASAKYAFSYTKVTDSLLVLHGKWHNDSLTISLRKYDINKFPIVNHRFRWIIDHNFYNRR